MSIITAEQLRQIDDALLDAETVIGFLSERDRHDWPEGSFSPDRAGDMLTALVQTKLRAVAEMMETLQP
ncbi:MAG TPA: hypothetical protein PJ986_04090 [Gammaproteobacteria bacterium]|nr:hypothetical protein [Gammaproteobacteria bacterium]